MAAIKASVNLFALLDGNDPGDKRLVDFDSELKDQPKKKPASPGYKPKTKKEQPSGPAKKKPASTAASTKKPTLAGSASGFKSEKNSPAPAAGYKAPRKNLAPAQAATAPSMATAMSKQPTPAPPAPPAPSANLTSVLFAYPSARERIFKQRQEEFERRQAKARQEEYERQQAKLRQEEYERQQAKVNGDSDDDGKSAAAGAKPAAEKRKGKTHGVRVQQQGDAGYDGTKQMPVAAVKEAPTPAAKEPEVAPVVLQTPPPPPCIDDIAHFPSLK